MQVTHCLLEWFLSQTNDVKGYTNAFFNGFSTNELSKIVLEKIILNNNFIRGIHHVSSKKIWNELGFKANYNIEDAVKDLKNAFEKKILNNCLDDINYFNIKKMQNINMV